MRWKKAVLLGMSAGLAPGGALAADDGRILFSEFKVTQFHASTGKGLPTGFRAMDEKLVKHIETTCSSNTAPPAPTAAPLAMALGGIVIDWLFSRAAAGISKRLQDRIKAHSAAYENDPRYGDMFDKTKWNGTASCIVAQRIDCMVDKAIAASTPRFTCGAGGKAGLSLAFRLENGDGFLRVMPVAYQWKTLRAMHANGDATLAASMRIAAVGRGRGKVGYAWSSESVTLLLEACAASKSAKGTQWADVADDCLGTFAIDDDARARAQPIPMPPSLTQAIIVQVGEVGEPSSRLKGFAEFFAANGEGMSAALSAAFQKKIGLEEKK